MPHNSGMKNSKNKGGDALTTVAPVTVSPVTDAEFVDAPGLQSLFSIKRSLAYSLLADGLIKGVSLRRRGRLRGKRLFEVASVRGYLASQMETEEPGQTP
jgi:hypothetical protein